MGQHDGDPSPGSLKVTASFTGYDQYIDTVISGLSPRIDATGKVLKVVPVSIPGPFSAGRNSTSAPARTIATRRARGRR